MCPTDGARFFCLGSGRFDCPIMRRSARPLLSTGGSGKPPPPAAYGGSPAARRSWALITHCTHGRVPAHAVDRSSAVHMGYRMVHFLAKPLGVRRRRGCRDADARQAAFPFFSDLRPKRGVGRMVGRRPRTSRSCVSCPLWTTCIRAGRVAVPR